MQPITIRIAAADDQKPLEALQWRASLEDSDYRDALLANPDAIELPLEQIEAGGVFVAETSGCIKGFAAILPREDGDFELDGLFVEPDSWRSGVGRTLVEHCCVKAGAAGASALHVVANPHAEGFYAACGFENSGATQTRFGVALLMKRSLR